MKRVYCLYRVSTKQQSENGDIPMQQTACSEFARKKGWIIIKEFKEIGVSGYNTSLNKRDAITQIRADAVDNKFDVLLVFMFDRIGRREEETPFALEWMILQGIEVWSVQEGQLIHKDHADKLLNFIRFWQAEDESISTSHRVKTRFDQLTIEGKYHGGTVPYGYCLKDVGRKNKHGDPVKDIFTDEDQAIVVRDIYNWYLNEELGIQKIANRLNERQIPTRMGKPWSANTVYSILKNQAYIGVLKSGDTCSSIFSDLQIISDSEYQRVQERLSYHGVQKNSAIVIVKSAFPGKVFCGICGSPMTVRTTSSKYKAVNGAVTVYQKRCYFCSSFKKGIQCHGQSTYNMEKVEIALLDKTDAFMRKLSTMPYREFKSKTLEKQHIDCKQCIRNAEEKLEQEKKKYNYIWSIILAAKPEFTLGRYERFLWRLQDQEEKIQTLENEKAELFDELEHLKMRRHDVKKTIKYLFELGDGFPQEIRETQLKVANMVFEHIALRKGYQIDVDYTEAAAVILSVLQRSK